LATLEKSFNTHWQEKEFYINEKSTSSGFQVNPPFSSTLKPISSYSNFKKLFVYQFSSYQSFVFLLEMTFEGSSACFIERAFV